MPSTALKCSVAILSLISITACSGQGYTYGNQNYSRYGSTPTNIAPTYGAPELYSTQYAAPMMVNPYTLQELRGPQPVYYGQGTVLGGNAPYGTAAYHPRHTGNGFHNHKKDHSGMYVTSGTMLYDVDNSATDVIAQLRVGYNANQYFGAELEGSAKINIFDNNNEELDHSVAAFGVAKLPITNRVSAFARGGYHFSRIDPIGPKENIEGIAYGAGLEVGLRHNTALRAGYTIYENGPERANTASLSYVTKF